MSRKGGGACTRKGCSAEVAQGEVRESLDQSEVELWRKTGKAANLTDWCLDKAKKVGRPVLATQMYVGVGVVKNAEHQCDDEDSDNKLG